MTAFAQGKELIKWTHHCELQEGDEYRVIFTGKIAEGYHTYTLTDEFSATEFMDMKVTGGELVGNPYEISTPKEEIDEFGDPAKHYYDEIILAQNVKLTSKAAEFTGTIFTNTCTGGGCSAGYYDFNVVINPENAVMAIGADETEESSAAPVKLVVVDEEIGADAKRVQALLSDPDAKLSTESKEAGSIWGQILEAILWGFIMLLTPCVFPMVPMTVSFFLKGSENVAAGRFKAAMYGVFIVLIYTVPIAILILATRFVGGDAVTANIFNWLSTHWIPNILFFVIFMIFAASFF